jgi:exonuclease III
MKQMKSLPGYTSVHYCRTKRYKTPSASGGISVFVKEELRKLVTFLPQSNSDVVWLKVQQQIGSSNHNLYIGCVYIPPQFSSFGKENTQQIWDSLEQDIEHFSNKSEIIICGDFNARSGRLIDYIQMDNNHNYYNLPNNYVYDNCYKRCSMDLIVQKNGRRLVNMCTDNQLYILNGRMLGDLQGKCTCFHPQGCSVVDYIICSQALMKNVKYMKVKELMEHSDHCPVDFEIYIPCIDRVNCKILLKKK